MSERDPVFATEVIEMVDALKRSVAVDYGQSTPSDVVADLEKIDRALTGTLQVLLPLSLRHRDGQDLETEPFNWPLVTALQMGRWTNEIMRSKVVDVPAYPTGVIDELIAMRDAARSVVARMKPKRGNSSSRNARTALIDAVAKNFVFRYRRRFCQMPPITRTGWVVDLLSEALALAGVDDVDAADALRRAIEKDEVGLALLPSASAKPAQDGGSNAATGGTLKRRRKD